MRSAPPRGMRRSTRPRAVISARTAPWPPSRRVTASTGRPWPREAGAQDGDERAVGVGGRAAPTQDDGVAGLQAQPGGVDGDVGAGLVDHADDAHRDADLTDLQAVGQGGAADDLAHRVGQGGDVAQGLGDGGHARGVQAQAVLEALGHAVRAAAVEVLPVGLDDVVGGGLEGVGQRAQGGVLLGPAQQGEAARGRAGGLGEGADLLDVGGVDPGGALGHGSRVGRRGPPPSAPPAPRPGGPGRARGDCGSHHQQGVFRRYRLLPHTMQPAASPPDATGCVPTRCNRMRPHPMQPDASPPMQPVVHPMQSGLPDDATVARRTRADRLPTGRRTAGDRAPGSGRMGG